MVELPGPLVDVGWLAAHLDEPDLVVLDATIAPHTVEELQIPGARRFDIDGALSDPTSGLPHTMPDAERFTAELRALGVRTGSAVVVYDSAGIYSSARAWWMLRAMGIDTAAVLDGGLPAWEAAGLPRRPFDVGAPAPGDVGTRPRPELFVDADAVAAALANGSAAVLDARSRERFAGRAPEPRPGLRGGHIPGSVNLPYTELQPEGRLLGADELRALFADAAPHGERLVLTCGSGVTACVLALGAHLAGRRDLAVYDGSWSEWGRPSDRPVATD